MHTLTINMHFACNAKCIFCVVGIPGVGHCDEKIYETTEEMISELKMGRKKGYTRLVLSGGEPTIHPDLLLVVQKAKEMGFCNIEIKSNGIRLKDEDFVKSLAEAGVDDFCISIQGPNAETHDHVVGVPGAFNSIMKAVKCIHRTGKRLITPTCIQQASYKKLPDTIELFKRIGSVHCSPTFIEPNGSARENFEQVVPRYDEVLPYLDEAIEKLETSEIIWSLHGFPMCKIPNYEYKSLDLVRVNHGLAKSEIGDYLEYEKKHFRTKDVKCNICLFDSVCSGPWANYVKIYGFEEFTPVTSGSLTDYIPLPLLMNRFFSEVS